MGKIPQGGSDSIPLHCFLCKFEFRGPKKLSKIRLKFPNFSTYLFFTLRAFLIENPELHQSYSAAQMTSLTAMYPGVSRSVFSGQDSHPKKMWTRWSLCFFRSKFWRKKNKRWTRVEKFVIFFRSRLAPKNSERGYRTRKLELKTLFVSALRLRNTPWYNRRMS